MKDAPVGMLKEGEMGVLDEVYSFRDSLRIDFIAIIIVYRITPREHMYIHMLDGKEIYLDVSSFDNEK